MTSSSSSLPLEIDAFPTSAEEGHTSSLLHLYSRCYAIPILRMTDLSPERSVSHSVWWVIGSDSILGGGFFSISLARSIKNKFKVEGGRRRFWRDFWPYLLNKGHLPKLCTAQTLMHPPPDVVAPRLDQGSWLAAVVPTTHNFHSIQPPHVKEVGSG